MKNILKKIIVSILKFQSQVVLKKYKPRIIAVTGSVGKTSTKDAIYTALLPFFHIRKSAKSFNSDIGIPLTILGLQNAWNDPKSWLKNIWNGFILCIKKQEYPEYLVLEVGADRPGEIKDVMSWVHPDISVVTRVGEVPVHVEFYSSPKEIAKEKSELVKAVSKKGFVVLNADDADVYEMKKLTDARVISFGINSDAQVRGSFPEFIYDKNHRVVGTSFKVDVSGSSLPISIMGALGNQHIYPVLASLAVVYGESLNLLKASENFATHESTSGRMKLVEGIKDTVIIDDSYNASPVAMEEGLNTLKKIKNEGRKISVLGDMLELGRFSHDEHVRMGEVAFRSSDVVVAVGLRAKDLGEKAEELKSDVYYFNDSKEAGDWLKDFLNTGDVIYVKGSQGVRMERVVERIMKYPEKKSEILVRQEKEWLKR